MTSANTILTPTDWFVIVTYTDAATESPAFRRVYAHTASPDHDDSGACKVALGFPCLMEGVDAVPGTVEVHGPIHSGGDRETGLPQRE